MKPSHVNKEIAIQDITRRHFFGKCGVGLGSIALASLLSDRLLADPSTALLNPLGLRHADPVMVARVRLLLSLALTWLMVGLGDAPAVPAVVMSSPAALSIAAAANTPRRMRGDRMSRRVPT